MKKIVMMSSMIFAIGLLGFTSVSQAYAANPPSYLMMCRGGEGMYAQGGAGFGPSPRLEVRPFFIIHFKKSPIAAESRQPGPGQCAWMRRPLNQNEPPRLRFPYTPGERNLGIVVKKWIIPYQYKASVKEPWIKPKLSVNDANANVLLDAVKNGSLFYVHVYNFKQEYMIITRVGP